MADAAVLALQVPELTDGRSYAWSARLSYAYADALAEAGRTDDARDWFARAADADVAEETDAAERFEELDGVIWQDLAEDLEESEDPAESAEDPEDLAEGPEDLAESAEDLEDLEDLAEDPVDLTEGPEELPADMAADLDTLAGALPASTGPEDSSDDG